MALRRLQATSGMTSSVPWSSASRVSLSAALRARVDSLDVLQEVYLHAQRDLAHFHAVGRDPERAFVQWLCAIAQNRLTPWP